MFIGIVLRERLVLEKERQAAFVCIMESLHEVVIDYNERCMNMGAGKRGSR